MKKIKKYLSILILVVASMCCLTSCSCSFGKNRGDGGEGEGGGGGSNSGPVTTYYEVTVNVIGDGGGVCESSTGSNIHLEGSSPVYTVKPNATWGIKKIVVNNKTIHSYTTDGYIFTDYDITIDSISENTSIEVTLAQVQFTVTYEILDSGYSSAQGARVETDNLSDIYLGGSAAEYEVIPEDGYVIYSVKINNEPYYSYTPGDVRASEKMVLTFDEIIKNIHISVEAYKLEDVGCVLVNYHSGGFNKYGESASSLLEGDNMLASFRVEGFDGKVIPSGYGGKVYVTVKDGARLIGYEYSTDAGVSYSAYSSTDTSSGSGASFVQYDSEGGYFIIKEISPSFRLKVYTTSEEVELITYYPDAPQGEQKETSSTIYLYSYYIVPDEFALNYSWFYSTSADHDEPNTHKAITLTTSVHPTSGELVYHIYIEPSMLNTAGKIVLIYTKN